MQNHFASIVILSPELAMGPPTKQHALKPAEEAFF